ncbi:hypothetical protein GCM10010307_57940 [Streptomyces vastus]|uniref:Uncharacterized protein n=1 Tax=Streptomyces vastus TaxID=285451 RepID=A0ABP6DTE2_9ACTN
MQPVSDAITSTLAGAGGWETVLGLALLAGCADSAEHPTSRVLNKAAATVHKGRRRDLVTVVSFLDRGVDLDMDRLCQEVREVVTARSRFAEGGTRSPSRHASRF